MLGRFPATHTARRAMEKLGMDEEPYPLVETLVVHINRKHLIQESAETYIEMCPAWGVKTVVFVVTDEWEEELRNCIKNIRRGTVELIITNKYEPTGIVAVLKENEGQYLQDVVGRWFPNTVIVGPDAGEDMDYEGFKVKIPVRAKNHLWSWQCAAIALYAFNS